jgi:hypothetical protein
MRLSAAGDMIGVGKNERAGILAITALMVVKIILTGVRAIAA